MLPPDLSDYTFPSRAPPRPSLHARAIDMDSKQRYKQHRRQKSRDPKRAICKGFGGREEKGGKSASGLT